MGTTPKRTEDLEELLRRFTLAVVVRVPVAEPVEEEVTFT